jgi:class 3 adenylate cyclase
MVIPGRRYDLLRHRGRSRGSATETLTFLFTDLEGSTALLERLGDETYPARGP